jgi:hypothetical protein
MPGDDDEHATETQRLVQELAEVRKRMQMRAEQPPLRNGSGQYRAVTSLPSGSVATKAAEARTSPPPAAEVEATDCDAKAKAKARDDGDTDDAPPTRRRP